MHVHAEESITRPIQQIVWYTQCQRTSTAHIPVSMVPPKLDKFATTVDDELLYFYVFLK